MLCIRSLIIRRIASCNPRSCLELDRRVWGVREHSNKKNLGCCIPGYLTGCVDEDSLGVKKDGIYKIGILNWRSGK